MNATTLYVSTCRYILQAEHSDPNTWGDLYRRLPILRRSLSCCVCAALLIEPMGPGNSTCQHFVCRSCVGRKMLLKPSCSWCKDYSLFVEVKQLTILLSCFKKLCEYIADTPLAPKLVGSGNIIGTNNHGSSSLVLLQEGMAIAVNDHERSKAQPKSGFNIIEYLTQNIKQAKPVDTTMHNGHLEGNHVELLCNKHPSGDNELCGTVTKELNVSTAARTDGLVGEYSVTITPNMDNQASPKIKIKRNKRLEHGHHHHHHHHHGKSGLHLGLSLAKVKRKYRRSKSILCLAASSRISSNGVLDLDALSNAPMKLVISGHRAKLLKEGRKIEIKGGCRCGTATKLPGLNTCQGHRCPCFVSEIPCFKCRCKGCKNPLRDPSDDRSSGDVEGCQGIGEGDSLNHS